MNTISIAYSCPATIELTTAEFDLIHGLYNPWSVNAPDKISCIKFLRGQHGLGLKAAKDICDAVGAMPRREKPFSY